MMTSAVVFGRRARRCARQVGRPRRVRARVEHRASQLAVDLAARGVLVSGGPQPRQDGTVLWLAMQSLLPTVLGAIGGVAFTLLVNLLDDYVQFRRSEDTRLGEIRRRAYADWAAAQKLDMGTCRRMAAGRGRYPSGAKMTEDEGLAQLSKRSDERNVSFENLILVGSPEVVTAAYKWHDAVYALREFARNEPKVREDDFSKLYKDAREARDQFYELARADLRVKGTVSTPSTDEMSTTEE